MSLNKIVPHLWFSANAEEACRFYVSLFPESKITSLTKLKGVPSPTGEAVSVSFELSGYPMMAIDAGPLFPFNPSLSFFLNFDPSKDSQAESRLDKIWKELSRDGRILMPLDSYPFSRKYGWIQDRYGLSWQLILTNPEGDDRPFIIPSLMFAGKAAGRAEEAIRFYRTVFSRTKTGLIARYDKGQEPDREGTLMFADFMLEDQWFAAMDSARNPDFNFNESVSFIVMCDNQAEIDDYWNKLSHVPEAEQCGWLKDRFGVSWQIVPSEMNRLMQGTPEQAARVTQAFLPMKKLILAEMIKAYNGTG